MWLVNKVVMLLVDCQLSLVVIGCEDCTQWLVHFDPSFVSLMSVRVLLVKQQTDLQQHTDRNAPITVYNIQTTDPLAVCKRTDSLVLGMNLGSTGSPRLSRLVWRHLFLFFPFFLAWRWGFGIRLEIFPTQRVGPVKLIHGVVRSGFWLRLLHIACIPVQLRCDRLEKFFYLNLTKLFGAFVSFKLLVDRVVLFFKFGCGSDLFAPLFHRHGFAGIYITKWKFQVTIAISLIPFLPPADTSKGTPACPRMFLCGPSNSGKTNIQLHMLYELLDYNKVFLFSNNLHQNKYQALLKDFAENIDPASTSSTWMTSNKSWMSSVASRVFNAVRLVFWALEQQGQTPAKFVSALFWGAWKSFWAKWFNQPFIRKGSIQQMMLEKEVSIASLYEGEKFVGVPESIGTPRGPSSNWGCPLSAWLNPLMPFGSQPLIGCVPDLEVFSSLLSWSNIFWMQTNITTLQPNFPK